MNCDRCSKIPIFEDLSVCILVPTEHHIDPVKNSLLLKNINFKLVNDIFLVEEENLEKIINLFLEMNLSCIEKRDIKLMPLSEKNEIKYENLKKLKSLQYYIDFFSGKDILYVLDKSSIKTFFQPIISANTGEIYGYEALSRGIREDGSIIPPNELFSKARNMDLLFFLDRLCRETVIKNAAKQNISKKVFINFIPTSIYDPQKCLKSTDEALTKYKLDPKNIVFEVVETDYIEDYPHLNNILSYYKGKGYSTALDDIGSGYSDINALLALNPKYMKIDMNLIKNIDTKPKKQEKVVNYIKVAKENNIIALAEGIERKEEADVLIEMGIDLLQGYYYGKPCEIPQTTVAIETKLFNK